MAEIFNPQEILKIAISIEERGEIFYQQLSQRATDKKLKELFEYLKEEEKKHAQFFRELLNNINDYIAYENYAEEYEAYLKAISLQYVLTKKVIDDNFEKVLANEKEALDFAINLEKDSIFTYSAFKDSVKEEKKGLIDKIIQEERKHFLKLIFLKYSSDSKEKND